VAGEILKLFGEGYKPSDIFVLGPSVKGVNSNIRQLENILVERGIPCHVPMLENDKIDERVIDKKVVFSTFHCVKGRERKIVFILGFDNSYFRCYARNLSKEECPNTLYVAATRATERLYVLESDSFRGDRPLDFLKMSHVQMKQQAYIQFRGQHQNIFVDDEYDQNKNSQLITRHFLTPTELIKFIPENIMEDVSVILDKIFIKDYGEPDDLEITSIIETKEGFFEEVSDLNGIAIPCIYYDYLKGGSQNVLLELIHRSIENMRSNEHHYLKEIVKGLPDKLDKVSDYLYLANISIAVQETLYFKLKQIDKEEYNWLKEGVIEECKSRLDNIIRPECSQESPKIEETIIRSIDDDAHVKIDTILLEHFDPNIRFRFTARVDLITDSTVWELKCTSKISLDHLLQVVIYAWLWENRVNTKEGTYEKKKFRIFNIRTNELLSLNATLEDLNTIILALLKGKYNKQEKKSDEDFISDCHNTFNQLE
jgi:hypothetical protein